MHMPKTFLFPGQGAQKVGMGKDFYESSDNAKKRFDEANEIIGRDLSDLIFSGPEADLKATQNTQPSLFVVEAVITDLLKENGVIPAYTMGHSLGEYSALYAAGVYSFADGLRLVARRGELMAKAEKVSPGTMAAVIGLSKEKLTEVLSKIDNGVVVPANENTPEQTVISGDIAAVESACEKLIAAGAKRAIKLPVSGAFHSPLMQKAADEFQLFLNEVSFNDAVCPVIANVTAEPETKGDVLKGLLYRQLLSPVRWVDSMAWIKSNDAASCIEIGPGAVLKGLARKCDKEINVVSCNTVDNLYSLAN